MSLMEVIILHKFVYIISHSISYIDFALPNSYKDKKQYNWDMFY